MPRPVVGVIHFHIFKGKRLRMAGVDRPCRGRLIMSYVLFVLALQTELYPGIIFS